MNCEKCNSPLAEGAKFCQHCGSPVTEKSDKIFCPVCHAEIDSNTDVMFCPSCGVRLNIDRTDHSEKTDVQDPAKQDPVKNETKENSLPFVSIMVSMYNGTPTVGISPYTGKLSVYSDRIEFKKLLGNAIAPIIGALGTKKDPVEIYPLGQISSVSVGRYAMVYKTLVIQTKDNKTFTFCPAIPNSSEPQRIVGYLQNRIG